MSLTRAAALGVLVWLTGCSLPPAAPVETLPAAASSPWRTGRLAVKVEPRDEAPPQSMSAAFELQGDEHRGQMKLLSPLGTLLANARWDPHGVWLDTGQPQPQHFATLDELARATFGEDLPLPALMHWLAGQPWPGAPAQAVASGDGFDQLGWRVDVSALGRSGLLLARRDAPPVVTLRARLD